MPPERRLAAIMFTDLVGSTALMARSEEAGLWAKRRHRELVQGQVASYRGELDPLSLDSRSILGQLYLARGRPDLATEQLLEALELDPNYPIGNMWLGVSYSHLSLHEKAVAQLERAVEVSGQERALWPELAYVYARSGRTDDARQVVGEAEERSRFEYVMPMLMAEVFATLGDHEEMFSWLERAYRERDQSLRAVGWHPAFEGVRSDPRFQDLLRRMNYPGAS